MEKVDEMGWLSNTNDKPPGRPGRPLTISGDFMSPDILDIP